MAYIMPPTAFDAGIEVTSDRNLGDQPQIYIKIGAVGSRTIIALSLTECRDLITKAQAALAKAERIARVSEAAE